MSRRGQCRAYIFRRRAGPAGRCQARTRKRGTDPIDGWAGWRMDGRGTAGPDAHGGRRAPTAASRPRRVGESAGRPVRVHAGPAIRPRCAAIEVGRAFVAARRRRRRPAGRHRSAGAGRASIMPAPGARRAAGGPGGAAGRGMVHLPLGYFCDGLCLGVNAGSVSRADGFGGLLELGGIRVSRGLVRSSWPFRRRLPRRGPRGRRGGLRDDGVQGPVFWVTECDPDCAGGLVADAFAVAEVRDESDSPLRAPDSDDAIAFHGAPLWTSRRVASTPSRRVDLISSRSSLYNSLPPSPIGPIYNFDAQVSDNKCPIRHFLFAT